ncbi:AAA family ATPase [Croceicoccus naphthovorans]|uniref:DNA polymerase III subunit delta n=1 Tax=Croceicoccus naphthovorans TaxID=1348774 RepID=A0A0G3XFW1_9SPHN|nr:AAA family ATPase [Croceicoccus naphthovorans]AKM10047.1 DNA polymerase III subunit delta' [Croceicoccus naphthovorans]MBB3991241.1 DNA polymerase-3 subunit delta' [Croceicoccus naphthovorans]
MTALLGHDEPWREFRAAMAGSRMHHAWLLTGPTGVGKAQFALAAAAERVAAPGVQQPEPNQHPDILILTRLPASTDDEKKREDGKPYATKRSISVDQVRAMQRRLTTRPTLGANRAIVIDSVDDLEKSAVNALLKSLEEPPAGSMFLLVSHRPGGLLPTVRSRCRPLRFQPLSDDDVAHVVRREAPEAKHEAVAGAIAAAKGSPGAALAFLANDLAAIRRELLGIVDQGDPDFSRRGALAMAIGARPDRERLLACVELARNICAESAAKAPRQRQAGLIEAHSRLTRFGAEIPYANFDPGLAVVEIGGLLAAAAAPKEGR